MNRVEIGVPPKQAGDFADQMDMRNQILILDDDRDFARTMAQQLQSLGGEFSPPLAVEVAFDTVQATLKLNLNPPDLICLDVDLSHESGLAFCEYMAWNNDFSRIPIVVMTRREDIEDIRRSSSLELHFVDKSVESWQTFLDEIMSIMSQSKVRRRVASSRTSQSGVPNIDMRLAGPFTSL